MNQEQFEAMTPEQQEQACLALLAGKLQRAYAERTQLQPGDGSTLVLAGLTTIVARKGDRAA